MMLGAIGRIPFSAIDRWAERHRVVDSEQFDRLVTLVQAIDDEWIAIEAEKIKRARPAS